MEPQDAVEPLNGLLVGAIRCVLLMDSNLQSLEGKVGEVSCSKEDIKKRIDAAGRRGQQPLREVEWWLEQVDELQNDWNSIKVDFERQHRCFGINIWARYWISKRTQEGIEAADKLVAKAYTFDRVYVDDKAPPGHIVKMPTKKGIKMGVTIENLRACIHGDDVTIGLYGMGGVGKTTLLQMLNNELWNNKGGGFDEVLLLEASKNCDEEAIQCKIGEKFGLEFRQDEDFRARRDRVYKYLQSTNFIIILDDVWKPLSLTEIGIPSTRKGSKSKIVVATRNADVCTFMEVDRRIDMECLPPEEAWDLFLNKVGVKFRSSDAMIEELAKKMVVKCDGLPIALQTLGLAMASKTTVEEWQQTLWYMDNDPSAIPGMEKIFDCLKRSYDDLERGELKQCFSHLSLFPEGCLFEKRVLIRDFICHGTLDVSDGKDVAYGKGLDIINKLVSRNMLEIVRDDDGDDKVKMHAMMRRMVPWIRSDGGKAKNKWLVQAGTKLSEAPDVDKWRDAQVISLMYNNISTLPSRLVCPQLEFLVLMVNEDLSKLPGDFFGCMASLQVLDLSWTSLEGLPWGISSLVNLRHLDLNSTQLKSLPREVGSLQKLRYLDISRISTLERIPERVISNLSPTLQVLRMFRSYSTWKVGGLMARGLSMEELESLDRLKILDITINTREARERLYNSKRLAGAVEKLMLNHLQGVTTINLPGDTPGEIMRGISKLVISNSKDLQEVVISCGGGGWQGTLKTLQLIALEKMKIVYRGSQLAPCLKLLRSLEISSCNQIEEVVGLNDGIVLPMLRMLSINNLPELKSICKSIASLPVLRTLEVSKCPKLKSLPSGMAQHENLKLVKGHREWWDALEWEDRSDCSHLSGVFKQWE